LLMTPAASQRMMKMGAALWGSQSWLQPAFSRLSAEHEGSLTTREPPERRLQARLPAPQLFLRKGPPCASERSSDVQSMLAWRRATRVQNRNPHGIS
jgi:hypothetical protein